MPQYLISSGLPQLPSSGLDEENAKLVTPLYQGINNLAQRLSEVGGRVTYTQAELAERNQLGNLINAPNITIYPRASVDLSYGVLVNLYLTGGKIHARKATGAVDGFRAHGIVNAPQGIAAGDYGAVLFFDGYCAGVSGTTFGTPYYLGGNGLMQPTVDIASYPYTHVVALGLGNAGVYLRCGVV